MDFIFKAKFKTDKTQSSHMIPDSASNEQSQAQKAAPDSAIIESIIEDYVAMSKRNSLRNDAAPELVVRDRKGRKLVNTLDVLLRKHQSASHVLNHFGKILADNNRCAEEKGAVLSLLSAKHDKLDWRPMVIQRLLSDQVAPLIACQDQWLREQAFLVLGFHPSPGSLSDETVREMAISLLKIATSGFTDPMTKLLACFCLVGTTLAEDARCVDITNHNIECLAFLLSELILLVDSKPRRQAIRLLQTVVARHFQKSFRIFKSLTVELVRAKLQPFVQPKLDRDSLDQILDLFGSLTGYIRAGGLEKTEMFSNLEELWPDYMELFAVLLKDDQLDRCSLRTIVYIVWSFGDKYYVSDQVLFELLNQKFIKDPQSFVYISPVLADMIAFDKKFKIEQNLEAIIEMCQIILNDPSEKESLAKDCAATLLELLVQYRGQSLGDSLGWIVEFAMTRLGCCVIQSGWRERLTLVVCAAVSLNPSLVLNIFEDIDYVWSRPADMKSLDLYIAQIRSISGNHGGRNHKEHCKQTKKLALGDLLHLFQACIRDTRYDLKAIEAEIGTIEVVNYESALPDILALLDRAHAEDIFTSWTAFWMDSLGFYNN